MSRIHLTFPCESAQLFGTLDEAAEEAPGKAGLLIVTGGNETRAGAFSGQAQLAAQIAAAGHPVFRFDRRGVGDSEGENGGFLHSAPDISAALAAFRAAAPRMERVAGFGNCDGASALMLAHGAGLDALALANPWTIENEDAPPPPQAIRARYSSKLRDPAEILRLLSGKVSFGKLIRGIGQALRPAPAPTSLAQQVAAGLDGFFGPATILLAERDRTAQIFAAGWDPADPRLRHCPGASHAFVEAHAREWLSAQLLEMLAAL
ncbi:hydrolase 1, exosortase A system-associated [Altererythrobacter sp. CC-YST694]|uniref:hydrolase 1, exosortase A system-associated n=1 Tax=Altererythrobacter sp. CC-YST694 TaxID=2755038 RepID=UPI001D01C413|nr:hydrolase 1, exosortase A system-associated [Altererythrobacter sp. CC-YST694]MCB5424633.1 hydrolase 1, exosortase A system-associated [Altererythrobacter sp. CC-YST694]